MKLHYRTADIELLLLDIMVWRDDEVSLVENDSGENLDKFTRWTRSQKSERFDRKGSVDFRLFVVNLGPEGDTFVQFTKLPQKTSQWAAQWVTGCNPSH